MRLIASLCTAQRNLLIKELTVPIHMLWLQAQRENIITNTINKASPTLNVYNLPCSYITSTEITSLSGSCLN